MEKDFPNSEGYPLFSIDSVRSCKEWLGNVLSSVKSHQHLAVLDRWPAICLVKHYIQ